jgi:predicted enzyme related to lactoylglutathione lyase
MKNHRAGVVIYAKNLKSMAGFYEHVAGMSVSRTTDGFIALESDSFQLVVVQIPERLSKMVTIETPPLRRENATIKPMFSVRSLALAREVAPKFGGVLNEARQEWTFEGTTVCDGHDPEGNVFQLRET